MKLHLPKQLFTALLAAITLATPATLTLGSTAWGGWSGDSFTLESATTDSISTEGQTPGALGFFIRTGENPDMAGATVTLLQLQAGDNLYIDGSWQNEPVEFTGLTIETLEVKDAGSATLNVYANNTANINALTGTLSSLIVAQNATLTLDFASRGEDGSITERGSYTFGNTSGDGTVVIAGGTTGIINTGGASSTVKTNLKVLGGGELKLTTGDATGWDGASNATKSIVLQGSDADNQALLTLGASQTMVTSITLSGYGKVAGSGLDVKSYGATISASGSGNSIETNLSISKALEIRVEEGGELTVSGDIRKDNEDTDEGSITKAGSGKLVLSGNATFYNPFYQNAGTTELTGSQIKFEKGVEIDAGSTLTVGSASSALVVGGAFENSGILNINAGSISVESLDGFEYAPGAENGFWTTETYVLVAGNAASSIVPTQLTKGDATYTINAAQGTFSRDLSEAEQKVYHVLSGSVESNQVTGASVFHVDDAGTLIINGATTGTDGQPSLSVADILFGTEGAGTIVLATNAEDTANKISKATGNLRIQSAELTVGTSNSYTGSLTSFSSIELDGATLKYAGGATTFNDVNVSTNGASFKITDMTGANGIANAAVTFSGLRLDGDFTLDSDWKSQVKISNVSGAGKLTINKSSNSKKVDISIDSLQGYTGVITASGTPSGSLNTYLTMKAGGNSLNMGGLKLHDRAEAEIKVRGNSTISLGDVVLDDAAILRAYADPDHKNLYTLSLTSLSVINSGTLEIKNESGGWQGTFNIGVFVGEGATLNLKSHADTANQSVFNLNGGYGSNFNGVITLLASDTGSNRKAALNINNSSVAQNAIISLDGADSNDESVSLALGAATVAVRGIDDTETAGNRYILSGARSMANDNQDSDGISRTLVLNTQPGDVFSTSATVKGSLNLIKSGTGSQTFTGNMSAFNGLITVESGTLAIDNATGSLGLGGTIENNATLNLNTNFYADSADLIDVTRISVFAAENATDGFAASDATVTHTLVVGSGTTTIMADATITLGTNSPISVQSDGTFSTNARSDVYYVMTDEVSTSAVTRQLATGGIYADKTLSSFLVAAGGKLTVDSDVTQADNTTKNIANILTTTTGTGTIVLSTNATLANNTTLSFRGTLEIGANNTFTIGTTGGGTDIVNISSLSNIIIGSGAHFDYHAKPTQDADIQKLTVTSGTGEFWFHDSEGTALSIGEINVSKGATLKMTSKWFDSATTVGRLIGAGILDVYSPSDNSTGNVTIQSLAGFSGDMNFTKSSGNGLNVTVNTGTTAVDFGILNVLRAEGQNTNVNFTLNVQADTTVDMLNAAVGTVNLAHGTTLTLGQTGEGAQATTSSIGTVVASSAGNTIHLNEKATLNRLSNVTGTVILAGNGTYNLGNSISATNVNGLTSSAWQGTVLISEYTTDKPNLSELTSAKNSSNAVNANGLGNANSTVELAGVYGYFHWNRYSEHATIKLTNKTIDNETYAVKLNDGSSSSTMYIDNDLTGTGDMVFTRSTDGTYEFHGDTSAWGGRFINQGGENSKTTTLKFLGTGGSENSPQVWFDANSATAGVKQGDSAKSTLNVQIGNDASHYNTFNGVISGVSTLTVKGTTTFNKDVNLVGSLSAADAHVKLGQNVDFSLGSGTANAVKAHRADKLTASSSGVNISVGAYSTLTLSNYLDLSKGGDAAGQMTIGANAKVSAAQSFWMNKNYSILLEDAAELIWGSGNIVTIAGRADGESRISSTAEKVNDNIAGRDLYGSDNEHFILQNVDVSVAAGADGRTMGNLLTDSSVTNTGSGTLTVNNSGNTLTKVTADKGDVKLAASMQVDNIAAKSGKVVSVTSGNTIAMGGGAVSISANGAAATLTAKSDNALAQLQADASFTIEDMTLSNVKLSAAQGTTVALNNLSGTAELAGAGSYNIGTGAAQYTLGMTPAQVGTIENDNGGTALTLKYTSDLAITMSGTGSRLLLSADPTVDVNGIFGTYNLTLTLNYTLAGDLASTETVNWQELVGFTGILGDLLTAQTAEATVDLAEGEAAVAAAGTTPTVEYNYKAPGEGAQVGMLVITINGLNVPEPATSTLSLLALAALAARRRRK